MKRYTKTTEVKALHQERGDAFITVEAHLKSNAKEEEERGLVLFPSQHNFPFTFISTAVAVSWSGVYIKMRGNWIRWLHAGPRQSWKQQVTGTWMGLPTGHQGF